MEHFFHSIPGNFDFHDIYDQAVREAPEGAQFVEVGVWKGRSAAYMGTQIKNSGKHIRLYLVDMWDAAVHLRNAVHAYEPASFEQCKADLEPIKDVVTFVGAPSVQASALFGDGSCDFVFIDADHAYEPVLEDLKAWFPKVKPGGVFAGHDYSWEYPGVLRAVKETFGTKVAHRNNSWWLRKEGGR